MGSRWSLSILTGKALIAFQKLIPLCSDCRVEVYDSNSVLTVHKFVDDPYLTEDRVFLEAVKTRDSSQIRSPYSDAVETYKLSYAIQNPVQRV